MGKTKLFNIKDLKGEKGEPGSGLRILEFYATLEELSSAIPTPSVGDAYGVGSSESYDIYVYSEKHGWVNNGSLAHDINEQTPNYEVATELESLSSGEKISIAFGKIKKAILELISHLGNKNNPHEVTKEQVGLGNVDNTSDADKPVSIAQATAIADAQANLDSHVGDTTKHITAEERTAWNNKSAEGHLHDDRYYTESEIDSKMSEKASTTHSHTKSEIIDFPTSLPASDVPDWAKQTSKPSYTADDVGAMSKTKHLEAVSIKEITEEGFYYVASAKDVPTSTKFGYVRVVVADANNRTISWHPRDAVAEYINTMNEGSWIGWCRVSAAPM